MCGIAGFLDLKKEMSAEHMQSIVQAMADTIQHRGPDDGGIWYDSKSGVALGSRRLAVIDLSPLGHQPMFSASKRYAIVYNGEIYNYQALREELAGLGHTYQGSSDTEVMLAAFCEWGIRQAVEKFNGMFAFAVWDQVEQTLYLARDRMGEKPLYYGWLNGHVLFGSELKALQKHPAFTPEINREALVLYLRYAYVPAPYSIYQGIYKLPPATILTLRLDDPPRSNQPEVYWPAKQIAEQGFSHPFTGSEKEILTDLDALLRDAVKRRMIADGPNLNGPIPQITGTQSKNVTPLPEVTATAQIGLDLTPSLVTVSVDSQRLLNNDLAEIESLRSQIEYKFSNIQGKRVGLVITLGYHQTVANGMKLARMGNELLVEVYPEIFDRSVMKPFWYSIDDNHPVGTITFEIYFFTIIL